MTAPGSPYLSDGTLLAGRYAVTREIGRGGFSVVYLARDQHLNTDVAIKLLVPPPAAAALARERMRREVQAVRGLSHSNIVAVHDFVDDGPWSFVVMEYIAGPDLAERVRRRGLLSPEDTVRLGREVAEALAMAHRHGVIHRDVKPQNILIDSDGRARLTDFGSAKLDGVTGVTRTGGLVGTLDYMAPELLAGRRGDGRADLYALGLTLHFALTGRLPERPSGHAPVPASANGYRPSQVPGAPALPPWLDELLAQATMAAPERRFPSAKAMAEALATGPRGGITIREAPVEYCALCREADPFGLGLCVRCGGTSPDAADFAIVVRPPRSRRDRESVRGAVHQLLGGRVESNAADAAAAGERVLLRVPKTSVDSVLEHLADRGVPVQAVPASRSWTALPLRFHGLVMTMAVVGVAAGGVVPLIGWASPVVAGVWWVLAFREIRRPALASVGLATPLPPGAERAVVAALTELPRGTARELLADVVRVGGRMSGILSGTDADQRRAEVGRVLEGASRAARQVAALEESLAGLERQAEANTDPKMIDAADALERGRDRLVQELLETLTAMGRAQGRLALAGAGSRTDGDDLAMLARELEESVALRAEAVAEVEASLGSGTAAA
jgi:predicted Ser/Thr protein kinase